MHMRSVLFVCSVSCAWAAPVSEPPKLRLDGNVQPSRYAADLTIIPDRDTFRGAVDIDVDVRAASPVIWLNSTALQIQDASFHAASGDVLTAHVSPGGNDFVGLSFDRLVSGKGVLHIAYEGKISRTSSAGLFQQKEG